MKTLSHLLFVVSLGLLLFSGSVMLAWVAGMTIPPNVLGPAIIAHGVCWFTVTGCALCEPQAAGEGE